MKAAVSAARGWRSGAGGAAAYGGGMERTGGCSGVDGCDEIAAHGSQQL
jgi:hypothetical protein